MTIDEHNEAREPGPRDAAGMTAAIAFIGMGEAGSAIVSGWGERRAQAIRAYDIKSDCPATAGAMAARYQGLGITGCASPAAAMAGAGIVFCTVTADQAVVAAKAAAPHLAPGAFWCDLNSCAPSSKRRAAEVIEAAGGRYVDVAVMAAVHPKRNMTPLLISGPHAEAVAPILSDLPMAPRVVAGEVGAASSIKMIRSVMVKGLEALTAECVLAAVAAGVEDEVLGSLMRQPPGHRLAAGRPPTTSSARSPTASAAPPRWRRWPEPSPISVCPTTWRAPPSSGIAASPPPGSRPSRMRPPPGRRRCPTCCCRPS